MITEDYVSFETAKLLKEKGFAVPYDSFRGVYINGEFKRLNPGDGYFHNIDDEIIEVCSLQMAMKWLRENYKMYLTIHVAVFESWSGKIDGYRGCIWFKPKRNQGICCYWVTPNNEETFDSYEEASEASIKYCLENLMQLV